MKGALFLFLTLLVILTVTICFGGISLLYAQVGEGVQIGNGFFDTPIPTQTTTATTPTPYLTPPHTMPVSTGAPSPTQALTSTPQATPIIPEFPARAFILFTIFSIMTVIYVYLHKNGDLNANT
jgi:hypothetical protein